MDHEAYENEMIDSVNRHAGESGRYVGTYESTGITKKRLLPKAETTALTRGLKRMLVAIFTAVLFALSILSFILVATATGYWAVFLFFAAVVLLIWAFVFLYAQGITDAESKGDDK